MLKNIETSLTMLSGIGDDDRAAWERFVRVYYQPMLEFAVCGFAGLGLNVQDAEDVVCCLFERFARKEEKFDKGRGTLRRWLMMRLEAMMRDAARRLARERGHLDQLTKDVLEGAGSAERKSRHELEYEQMQKQLAARAIKQALEGVDARTRAIFTAVAMDGADVKAVAKTFGVTENNVYQIKNRIMGKVRKILEECPIP